MENNSLAFEGEYSFGFLNGSCWDVLEPLSVLDICLVMAKVLPLIRSPSLTKIIDNYPFLSSFVNFF